MKLSYSTPPKLGAPCRLGIGDVDDDRTLGAEFLQSRRNGAMEFAIGQKEFGLTMLQAERDQRRVEADVDGIEDRADHRRRVMGFEHGGRVGGEDGDRVAALDAGLGERVRQPPCARVELPIGETPAAMDDGRALAEEIGRALEKTHRAQRHEIRRRFLDRAVLSSCAAPYTSFVGTRHRLV